MLTFINSYLLPLLSLAALPILIHLFSRRKLKKQPFSDLRFLEEIQRKRMRRIKLRQWVLLIIRTLAVFFIAAAFTRPAIKGVHFGGVGAHERTAVAILIDNSYSTSATLGSADVFAHEKSVAKKILSTLREGDAAAVATFSEKVRWLTPKPSRFFANLSAIIDTVTISDEGTNISKAVEDAVKILGDYHAPNYEIYLLTDDCAIGWRKGVIHHPDDMRVYVFPFSPDRTDNRAITKVEFPAQFLEIGTPFELSVRLTNYGKKPAENLLCWLVVDGEKKSQTTVTLPAGASIDVKLSAQVEKGGLHWGYAAISEDNPLVDNRRYFTFKIPKQVRVLIVGRPELRQYIKLALAPEGGSRFFKISEVSESQLGQKNLEEFDIVIYIGPKNPTDIALGRLRAFVSGGGGLVVMPDEPSARNAEKLKQILSKFSPQLSLDVVGDTASLAMVGFGKADFGHPILSVFAETGVPDAGFKKIVRIVPYEGNTILHFANDMPAISEVNLGDGRVLLCGFSPEPSWGNLILSGFFVPFVHRSCQYLASDVAAFDVGYMVGGNGLKTLEDYESDEPLKVIFPDGRAKFVAPRFLGGKATVIIDNLPKAGIYWIVAGNDTISAFAANVNTEESNLEPLTPAEKKRINVVWLNSEGNIEKQVLQTKFGVELARPLLVLALLLLAAEMIIETSWRKKTSKVGAKTATETEK